MGHFETVNWLLYNFFLNLEAKGGSDKRTPFLFAAEKGHLDILKALEEDEADVYAKDKYGKNALHFACMMGHFETVNWLLNNCNFNLEDKNNRDKKTPFLLAAKNGHLDILKSLKKRDRKSMQHTKTATMPYTSLARWAELT